MIKSISQIPQIPMTAWTCAEFLYGKEALDANHLLASEAYQQMESAGWKFLDYDENGDELFSPEGVSL